MSGMSIDELEELFNDSSEIKDESLKALSDSKKKTAEKEEAKAKSSKKSTPKKAATPKKKPEPKPVDEEGDGEEDDDIYALLGVDENEQSAFEKRPPLKDDHSVEGFDDIVEAEDDDYEDIEDFDIEGDVYFDDDSEEDEETESPVQEEENIVTDEDLLEQVEEAEDEDFDLEPEEPKNESKYDEFENEEQTAEESEDEGVKAEAKELRPVEEKKTPKQKYEEQLKNEREQLEEICEYPEYLDDPQYERFYKEKLRVIMFLEERCPDIDFDAIEEEIQDMFVPLNEDKVISLDQFNSKLEKVQAHRNRLTRIKSLLIKDYVLRKKVTRMLEEYLAKQSSEKSQDKRNGEVQLHMFDLSSKLAQVDAAFQDVEQIGRNLDSVYETLSRQITCIQERNKEISRGEEPYIPPDQDEYDKNVREAKKKPQRRGWQDWADIV
jgi:hypothetical protein